MSTQFKHAYYLFLILSCAFSRFMAARETFADLFKPIGLDYLYMLVDDHAEQKKELDHHFNVEKVYNLKNMPEKEVMSFSLFWKSVFVSGKQPVVNKETIFQTNKKEGEKKTFYDIYVQPLLEQLHAYKEFYPDWIARVYLAHDLKPLVPLLVEADAEVFLMSSSSVNAAPGTMWRFLAFDDPQISAVYVRDADLHDHRSLTILITQTEFANGYIHPRLPAFLGYAICAI